MIRKFMSKFFMIVGEFWGFLERKSRARLQPYDRLSVVVEKRYLRDVHYVDGDL